MPENEELTSTRNVTKGTVKRNDDIKLFDIFFAGDWKTSLRIAFTDVIVPKIADMIVDSFNAAVRALVYGEGYSPAPKSRDNNGYFAYNKVSSERRVPARTMDRYNVSELVFDQRMDAEEVLDRMCDALREYRIVSVFDFYDLAGMDTKLTDKAYGWTSLKNARVDRVRDGYIIRLPKPQPID